MTKDNDTLEILEISRNPDVRRALALCDINLYLFDKIVENLITVKAKEMSKYRTWFARLNNACFNYLGSNNKQKAKEKVNAAWLKSPYFNT